MEILDLCCRQLRRLSFTEKKLLESYLYVRLCQELQSYFKAQRGSSFCLDHQVRENFMFDSDFLIFVIEDILMTEEYSLSGIAIYTRIPKDVIEDLLCGINKSPSSFVWRKIVELHSAVRRELYHELVSKILLELK